MLRQAVADSLPAQGKMIGHSLPIDWQSMTRITGQLREEVRPCPDHRLLILKVRRPPWPHLCRRTSWMSNGSYAKRGSSPTVLCSRIHLGSEMPEHTWEDPETHQIRTVNQKSQNDWPKETQKKCPINIIPTTIRARLSLSEPTFVSVHMHCALFLLINT